MRPRSPLRLVAATLVALTVAGGVGAPVIAQDPSSTPSVTAASPGAAKPPDADELPEVLALPTDGELGADAARTPPMGPEAVDPAAIDLQAIATRLTDAIVGLPESDWTITDLAAAMDFDPTLPFAFVRDRIAYQPYAGVPAPPPLEPGAPSRTRSAVIVTMVSDSA